MTKSTFKIWFVLFSLIIPLTLFSGWDHNTHSNYVREAISILPVFDYEMCTIYKESLVRGAVEGEIHYRFIAKGKHPIWIKNIEKSQIPFLNGIPVNEEYLSAAVKFYSTYIDSFRNNIQDLNKDYEQIFFELGYFIHSTNNILIPQQNGGKARWQQLASDTSPYVLDNNNIEQINNLEKWLSITIKKKLNLRREWTTAAETENKVEFVSIAKKAHLQNIYDTASLLKYVINNNFGPAHPKVREKVAKHHEVKYKVVRGRKPIM